MKRILILIFLSVAACAAAIRDPQPASLPIPHSPFPIPQFERIVTPFRVTDQRGVTFDQAFLGGFDVPRPQMVDIDADGDLDLFVQERSNELMFLENNGNGYTWRTDKYEGLDVGEWTRFVDIDTDGDVDLLTEQPFSYMRLYRNDGSKQRARFVLAADSLRDQDGKAIFSDRQNIPNLVDVDCDGLLDLFIGRVEGVITRYEEISGSRTSGAPRFQFVTDRWENIEIIAQMGSAHGANTMFFADADGDRDVDLFWGDFFEAGVLLIQNRGSCQAPDFRGEPEPLMADGVRIATSGYNVPIFADIDRDDDLDLFIGVLGGAYNPSSTSSDNFFFIEQRPDATYTVMTRRYLRALDFGSESIPAAADIDGDGDLDLLVGSKLDPVGQQSARLYVLRNVGTAKEPALQLADTIALAESFHYAPALADLDADGDLDLVLGTWNQGIQFYRNQGSRTSPNWMQDTSATLQLTRGSNSTPALGDLDGDGDLDLLVGEASGQLNYFRNVGTRQAFRFELVSDEYQSLDIGQRSHPVLVDFDGDGDLDLLSGAESVGGMYYRNDGTRQEPKFVHDASVKLPLPVMSSPLLADLDGDGQADLLSGGSSGGLWFFKSTSR